MRVGTPPMLQLAALDAALDVFDMATMTDIRARQIALSERFVAAVERGTDLALASPRDPQRRGSQVSFRHEAAYAVMQNLIAEGVIGDVRAPDILRFGIAPLYNGEADVDRAADVLAAILRTGTWEDPRFAARKAVT